MKGSVLRGCNNVWISPHRLLELDRGFPALLSWFKDTEVGGRLFSSFRILSVPHHQAYLFCISIYSDFYLYCGSEDHWAHRNLELYKAGDPQSPNYCSCSAHLSLCLPESMMCKLKSVSSSLLHSSCPELSLLLRFLAFLAWVLESQMVVQNRLCVVGLPVRQGLPFLVF